MIEKLKLLYPSHKVLVTFFSPSGFEAAKKYENEYVISYLPVDTKYHAKKFIELVKPKLIIFVKYEFWYHHLSAAAFKHIPILLISAVFRENQAFFKWYGKFYRQMLFLFRHIFVQDERSLQLLKANNIDHCSMNGDTRFDRVKEIADDFLEIKFIGEFLNDKQVIVAGSTWENDEKILVEYAAANPATKFIIAPHEINSKHISGVIKLFAGSLLYSELITEGQLPASMKDAQLLIIDSLGLLSRLYKYATVTYVGGGFTSDGIHNILEAAVYGKPVIFGSNYKKYREGIELVQKGGAFSIADGPELKKIADSLLNNTVLLQSVGTISKKYVLDSTGATGKIIQFIQEKRLLTN